MADARTFHWGGMYGRIVTNPPYGERIMERREAEELYRSFGKAWAKFPETWKLYLLSSHTEFERTFGRRRTRSASYIMVCSSVTCSCTWGKKSWGGGDPAPDCVLPGRRAVEISTWRFCL